MVVLGGVIEGLYTLCVVVLALYGVQAIFLTTLYLLAGRRNLPPTQPPPTPPLVTVQLPFYNERHVAERLIDASASLDYPADKLQIQVLDDSDDITAALVQARVAHWQKAGRWIEHIRRSARRGYKAGALADALARAQGEYLAIFDADFVPPSDFLRATLPHFAASGNAPVGFVQTRWGHLNRAYSWLTQCQALALDGHFVVEQTGRADGGLAFGFNGSAGVWRRACLEDARVGGWQPDTLCEDLDLSYRAQLGGWRGVFLRHVVAPAEIPVQLAAYKRQQFRWAKGSVQTLRKLSGRVLNSPWSWRQRIAAWVHLGNYLLHPFMLLLLLLSLPMHLLDIDTSRALGWLGWLSFGPPLLFGLSQHYIAGARWYRTWAFLPLLLLLGTGLCFNNTRAVLQALLGRSGEFLRTPKFQVSNAADHWQSSTYRLPLHPQLIVESLLMVYACIAVYVAAQNEHYWSLPFLVIYAVSFATVVGVELAQSHLGRGLRRGAAAQSLAAHTDRTRS
jgi:cellulose synthase/poly-beta-1,6-N-acetylglucosamine synthase-like glycosyltransferase